MADERVIIHVDMDAFFAAVEQRDNPELRGRPVVVGADPQDGEGRGVVSTCSYEAREYGIHSAQPISRAYRLCPDAAFLPVHGGKYSRESKRIRRIFREFTPQVQPISIDEAFLDVTGSLRLFGGKRALAEKLQQRIEEETGLTASLGVAPNKLVAKIASDLEKPRGLVIVEPDEVEELLRPLPVKVLPGVGPKTQESLARLGITKIAHLADHPREQLRERFGDHGDGLWRKAHGIDKSPVTAGGEARSIGHEHTFGVDTDDWQEVRATLMWLCEKTARRLRKAEKTGFTVTTKIRFEDFTTLTRQQTLERPVREATAIYAAALQNLQEGYQSGCKLRLVGVTVSGLIGQGEWSPTGRQMLLFEDVPPEGPDDIHRRIARAEDAVKDRFGEDALRRGASYTPHRNAERQES